VNTQPKQMYLTNSLSMLINIYSYKREIYATVAREESVGNKRE
jgi:hypothetical protein